MTVQLSTQHVAPSRRTRGDIDCILPALHEYMYSNKLPEQRSPPEGRCMTPPDMQGGASSHHGPPVKMLKGCSIALIKRTGLSRVSHQTQRKPADMSPSIDMISQDI